MIVLPFFGDAAGGPKSVQEKKAQAPPIIDGTPGSGFSISGRLI